MTSGTHLGEVCVIPQMDFKACDGIRDRYDACAKEHLCSWIKSEVTKPGKTFDYGELLEQMCVPKLQFTEDERRFVVSFHESSFARKVLLPEILKWDIGDARIGLIAALYTIQHQGKLMRLEYSGRGPQTLITFR
jgi:hypothetical protein